MLDSFLQDLSIEPRPYQRRIITRALALLLGEHPDRPEQAPAAVRSVLIESPTGSGKTVMGLAVAAYLARTRGVRVGWVAMRRNLLAQAERENRERGFNIDLALISMFEKDPPHVDVLIVDEAQHDAAESMAALHSIIRPQSVLGLSATPFRSDRVKLCFDRVIRDADIQHLVSEGYLSRYHHYTIPDYTPPAVAECYAREPEKWGQTLFFFHRRTECQALQRALAKRGHAAEIVTAESDRERQLDDFTRGRTQILINMAILTEGFDCPRLQTVFCRPSSKGCTIQMAGRAFRKHPAFPIKNVVQCQKTRHPMVKTVKPEVAYIWSDAGWRSLTVNPLLNAVAQRSVRLIAAADVELPKLVQQHRPRVMPWLAARA